ncbi:M42 family metallopeptidase [Orenia marismortui]|uniref:Endoglucanase n=1 Tax=Orenia marismortui TaxID=46469 RepID=A0A4R8GYU8_9FIRM|nr:M42 family metallopeptidase [Orenia marismortui]TDX51683.1 endoglucanase [Orenia marismortui]
MEAKIFLQELSDAVGVSGYERKISRQVAEEFKKYTDSIKYDSLGNLISLQKGFQSSGELTVMLAAHMDEIGLMVTKIEDGGFLKFTAVGGVDPRTLVGQEVSVHGKESLNGVVGAKPPHIQSADERKKAYKMEDMYIDLGLSEKEIKETIRVGDVISIKRRFTELKNNRVTGKSLDDRAGVLMVLETLKHLKKLKHQVDVYGVATVQEEVGVRGAITSTYGIVPDIGIAIDVCHATMPGVSKEDAAELGKGPALGFGPHVHPKIFKKLKEIAKELDIPYQVDPSNTPAGTDAYAIQVTRSGIATALLSIPLRYMHTSVETVSLDDIKRGARLLAHFIAEINADFVEGLRCF